MSFRILSGIFLFISAAMGALPAIAQSSVHTYRVDWFQADDADCPSEAAAIASRFSAATGYPVLSAGCERPFSWKQDIVIKYQADAVARLVSTFHEFASDQGTYRDRETCEADLANEALLFEEKTGLPTVTAFCFPESSLADQNRFPFIARIDGFGTPARRPFVFDASIYAIPEFPREDLERIFAESLQQIAWVEEPRLRVDDVSSLPRVVVKYYATRERALTLDSIVSFEDIDVCHQKQANIEALLEEFGVTGLKSFCAREQFSDVAEHYYFGLTTGAYSIERAAGSFGGRAQCEAAIPNIIAQYAASTGSPLVKGFCSYERAEIWSNYSYFAKLFFAN
jgi:hypothetical protein